MTYSPRLRAATASLLVVVLASCGSTVAGGASLTDAAGVPGGGPAGDSGSQLGEPARRGHDLQGLGASSTSLPASTAERSQEEVALGLTQIEVLQGTSNVAGRGPEWAASTGPAGRTPAARGRGYDAKNLYIGIAVQENSDSVARSLNSNLVVGNQREQAQAVVDAINQQGGVRGRRLMPLYYDTGQTSDVNLNAQRACAFWTEDNKVFAVANTGIALTGETFYQCLAKADTPFVSLGLAPASTASYKRYGPYRWGPPLVDFTYLSGTWIDRLAAQAIPPRGTKVGIATVDYPEYRAAATELKRALEARGIAVAAEYYLAPDISTLATQASNAMLRFKSEDVTVVMSLASEVLFYMIAATNAGYSPHWAINSYMGPASLLEVTAPKDQLVRAVGVGFLPVHDVNFANDPGDVGAGETRCRTLMHEASQDMSSLALSSGYGFCDAIFFLTDAAWVGGGFTTELVERGALKNRRFQSTMTFGTNMTPARHAGAKFARDLAYVSACECFRYASREDHRFG